MHMQVLMTLKAVRRGEEARYAYPFYHGVGTWMEGVSGREVQGGTLPVTLPAPRTPALCLESVRRLFKQHRLGIPAKHKEGGGSLCPYCALVQE